MNTYIIQGIAYGLAAAVQPGPFQTYLISQALTQGWRRSLPLAAAPLLSDGPILVLVLLVLSRVPAWWVRLLGIAGGAFVLYLGLGAGRSWREGGAAAQSARACRHSVPQAALLNLLNPAPYLFWSLVTGPILLTGWREAPSNGAGMLAGFYLTLVAAGGAIIMLFGMADRLGVRAVRALQLLSALALAVFGFWRIAEGLWPYVRP